MTSFTPRLLSPTAAEPDPTKHVNYNLGMVLGVDDFTQEFAYLSGRDQWLARDLLGYGTVTGLDVDKEIDSGGPQVSVTQGVALSPRGRLIRVAPAQCASLNGWLASHHEALLSRLGSPAGNRASLRLFVVLGYHECPTDMVPIPGQPCRSEDETTAASRTADDFRLELRLEAPDQQEEDALRDFVAWLSQVEITDSPGGMVTVKEFEDAIRSAAYLDSSPPSGSPPDFMYGSPPERLRIHTSLAYEYLRAAFRVWVTELRPRWQPRWVGKGQSCSGAADGAGGDDCVLLAEVSFEVVRAGSGADWRVEDANAVTISEERRPYVLHLRMVQEWLLGERRSTAPSEGGSSVTPGFTVAPETNYGLTPKPGTSLDYARADHTHGTPPPPTLSGDVTGAAGAASVVKLRGVSIDAAAATPNDGQVLAYVDSDKKWKPTNPVRPAAAVVPETAYSQSADKGVSTDYARADHTHGTPPPPTLSGEVTGAAGSTTVAKIQSVTVSQTKPTDDGQVLAYNKSLDRWESKALPAATPPPAASNTVTSETAFGQQADFGKSSAYSRGDHTHGTPALPNLAGEVTGSFGATVVSKLQGLGVSTTAATSAQSGQVLTAVSTKDGTQWAAAALPAPPALPPAGGDLSGSLGNLRVERIQGSTVELNNPTNSEVLTFNNGAWTNAAAPRPTGDFVTRPAGLDYAIVAAGFVSMKTPADVSYNGLSIDRFDVGRIVVTFNGYTDPKDNPIRYVVKAMAAATQQYSNVVVNFGGFTAKGFLLHVTSNNFPVDDETLADMSFMIEVSEYGKIERRF